MGKLATTKPWAAKVPTVREYWQTSRFADELAGNMQVEAVQAAVDRGWAESSEVRSFGTPGILAWQAMQLYHEYCRMALRRPGVEVTELPNLRGRRVYVGELKGEGWVVPPAGRRLLLLLAASAVEVESAYGGLLDWAGSHFTVVITTGDVEVFAASVRDIVEEHVEEVTPRRRRRPPPL